MWTRPDLIERHFGVVLGRRRRPIGRIVDGFGQFLTDLGKIAPLGLCPRLENRAALGGRPAEAMCRDALHILRPRYSGKSLTTSPSAVCMAVKQVASAPAPTSMGQGAPQR